MDSQKSDSGKTDIKITYSVGGPEITNFDIQYRVEKSKQIEWYNTLYRKTVLDGPRYLPAINTAS